MLSGVFKKYFWFQYSVALFFSTSMGLLLFTTWTLSTRGTLVVLIPLFLWIFILAIQRMTVNYTILGVIIIYTMATIHRMFIILIPFLMYYILTSMLVNIKLKVKINTPPSKHKKYRNIFVLLFLSGVIIMYISPLLGWFGEVYSEFTRLNQINEMFITGVAIFGRNLGPLTLFLLLGLFLLAKKSGKDRHDIFILGCAILIAPLMLIGKYISTFSIIFFTILGVYGLLLIYRALVKRKKIFYVFTVTILITSFLMSGYAQIYEFDILSEPRTVDAKYLEIQGYDAALWLNQEEPGIITGSDQIVQRMSAITGLTRFPGQAASQIVYGFATQNQISIESRSLFDIQFYSESPILDTEKTNERIIWESGRLSRASVNSNIAQEILKTYQIETLGVNNYEISHSIFAESVMQTSYCIFYNQKISVYHIQ